MKTKILAVLVMAGLAGLIAGCVETVDGRSQAGVPWVKDRVEGRYEVPSGRVFEAAKAVLAFNGTLTGENTINHSLEAKVDQTSVFVRVEELDAAKPLTHVIVQTRSKGGATDLDLAHEIEKQIALKLVR
jgi:LytS/YehU family sensor histidine kinase